MALYVHAINQFITPPLEDKALRLALKELGIDARRMSRFTQLALLGALPLKEKIKHNTAIYLGSSFSSPSKFNKIFHNLQSENIPSPLDFMANLNNAATFHLSQSLKTENTSLFLAIDSENYWQPLKLAELDLSINSRQSALVGWAFEHYAENQQEGSCWLLVSTEAENAIAKVNWQALDYNPNSFLQDLHNALELV
ncbi:hypothetical protein ACWIW6_03485 [Ursidibacter sp. B-7004-1]